MSAPQVGDLVGGSYTVKESTPERLFLKSPTLALLGCGGFGVLLLLLGAVTWAGVIKLMEEKTLQDAIFSDGGKAALIYTLVGGLAVLCLGLIQHWILDGAAKTLTRAGLFGLRKTTWKAADLRLVFSIEAPDEEQNEPCKLLLYAQGAEEPTATFGVMAASTTDAATLLGHGRHMAGMLGIALEVQGEAKQPCEELAAALKA